MDRLASMGLLNCPYSVPGCSPSKTFRYDFLLTVVLRSMISITGMSPSIPTTFIMSPVPAME